MFPIPWNFPLRKKNGKLVNIGDAIDEGTEIPEHGEADAGKVLGVDENGDLEWSNEVPAHVEDDAGKLLSVDETGELEWSDEVPQAIQGLSDKLDDEIEARAILGAHNLMFFDLASIKALNTSGTWNDNVYSIGTSPNVLTFTVNSNLSITVDGVNGSSDVYLFLTSPNSYTARNWAGKKLSGASEGSNSTYRMYITASNDGTSWAADISQYDDEITIDSYPYYGSARIMISANATLSNVVFEPMISDAKDAYLGFTPPAMTNSELTEALNKRTELTASNLANGVTLNGDSFFIKIGRLCVLHVNIKVPELTTGTGTVLISGLPVSVGVNMDTLYNNVNGRSTEIYFEGTELTSRGTLSAETIFQQTLVYICR